MGVPLIFPLHWPEALPQYQPEALAKLPPGKRAKAERHVEKMRLFREAAGKALRAKIERFEGMAARGECYCDDEYGCPRHAEVFDRVYGLWWARNRGRDRKELQRLIAAGVVTGPQDV